MRRALALLIFPSFLLLLAVSAQARPLPKWINWDPKTETPHTYRRAGLTITTSVEPGDQPVPILTVAARGRRTLRVEGAQGMSFPSASFLVFSTHDSPNGRVILFRSYTGGAHCCEFYQLIESTAAGWKAHPLGDWDGDGPEPADINKDGELELVAGDGRFDYRLASHAGSLQPPVVYKVRHGGLVDVSTDLRYRSIYKRSLAHAREACKADGESLGTCLGYVAIAGRAGEPKPALALLDAKPDHSLPGPWSVPAHCGASPGALACAHEKPEKSFEKRHDAVVWFLTDLGYLPAGTP